MRDRGDGQRARREARQLERFPLGEIVDDGDDPSHDYRGLPASLKLLAPVTGRGVCVNMEAVRPDGARDSPRWGVWTYEYVRTTPHVLPDGTTGLAWGPIEETSLGLEAQGEFAHDVPAGLWHFWHPNGRLRAEGSFNEGKLSGEWKFWKADGELDPELSGAYASGERAKPGR